MASPIEEKFVRDNLNGSRVFEFGCAPGKFATELASVGYNVFGVDLYATESNNKYTFLRGDFMEMTIGKKFDNIIAVSSIEHCGIETEDFKNGDASNVGYHIEVANKLASMVTESNQLIVTVPFGYSNIYYVDKNGKNGTRSEIPNPVWGYRTFNMIDIQALFPTLDLVKSEPYAKIGDEYFDISSWKKVSLMSFASYNNKSRAVLCNIFKLRKGDNGHD
jgi:SAM-dependent methyltransferase